MYTRRASTTTTWTAAVVVGAVHVLALLARVAPAIEAPDCSRTVSIRWSRTSDRLYLGSSFNANAVPLGGALQAPTGGGCTTLSAIVNARTWATTGNLGPLYHYDRTSNTMSDRWTGDFFLNSSMYIQDNVELDITGPAYGGNVNNLYLRSDASKFITIRAHGGRIKFKGVSVQSLDRSANYGFGAPDENFFDGRSFVSAISEVVMDPLSECSGRALNTKGEARLDIHDSTFTYLGYNAAESYGISYKVRGLCKDHSNLDIMDHVSVWGDITDSHIHHLFFGHYSYGHQSGNWSGNHVHNNVGYGFDPHDDSDDIIISHNHVHNNGWHGIIASKRCNNVSIENNRVHDNGKNGIMLHRSSDNGTIANNEAYRNGDAGAAVFESSNVAIYGNNFHDNPFAIRFSLGSSNNDVYNNTFTTVGDRAYLSYAIFIYRGNDAPDVAGSDGKPSNNRFYDNDILANRETMKVIDTTSNSFENNVLQGEFSRFRNSTEVSLKNNQVPRGYEITAEGDTCFTEESSAPDVVLPLSPVC